MSQEIVGIDSGMWGVKRQLLSAAESVCWKQEIGICRYYDQIGEYFQTQVEL